MKYFYSLYNKSQDKFYKLLAPMKAFSLYKDVIESRSSTPRNMKCSLCNNQLENELKDKSSQWNYNCCSNCAGSSPTRTRSEPSSAHSLGQNAIKSFLTECTDEPTKKLYKTYKSYDIVQNNPPEIPQVHSKLKYSASLPLNKYYEKDYQECSLCSTNTYKGLLYKNTGCAHTYCLDCVQSLAISHPDFKTCYLNNCTKSINPIDIDDFYKRCVHKQRTKLRSFETLDIKDFLNLPQEITQEADSYLEFSLKYTNIFFLIGFLLIQDKLSQPPSHALNAIKQAMLDSFDNLSNENFVQKANARQIQKKLHEFMKKIEELVLIMMSPDEGSSLDPNIRPIVGDFILRECRKDEKIEEAFRNLARNMLLDYLDKFGDLSQLEVIKKLRSKKWESEEMPEEKLLEIFCLPFDYHLKFITLNGNKASQRAFGDSSSNQATLVLDIPYKNNFRAILYKTN